MNRKGVLIVDDEPLAREALIEALSGFDDIEIVGECSDGFEAVKAINESRPDIVFLDIQMPKLDGFDVLELLGEDPPYIVFVTAYDEYALKAFESHALDYILKPVRAERLKTTFAKVNERLKERPAQPVDSLLADRRERNKPLDRILVETDAPYLAPPPHRGKRNEPAYTAHTARVGAEIFGLDYADFAARTSANFDRLFVKAAAWAKAA